MNEQVVILANNGVAKGLSKATYGVVVRNGLLSIVDYLGNEVSVASQLTFQDINGALQGQVLVTDAVEFSDRTGTVNPDNALGQKGGEPYWGDDRLAKAVFRKITFTNVQAQAFADGIQKLHLGGFPIPAAEANEDADPVGIRIELQIDSSGGGVLPTTSDLYILVRLGTGVADLTEGSYLKITPTEFYEVRKMKGVLSLSETTGNLRTSLLIPTQEIAGAADQVTPADYLPMAATVITNDPTTMKPVDELTSFEFYIVGDWSPADFALMSISGSIELLAETTVSGTLA
jgi:hypothetical protein